MSGFGNDLEEEDLPFEEDILRHPYNLKSWWRYLEFKMGCPPRSRFLIYERGLKELPGSYKLWFHYLKERMAQVHGREAVATDQCESINSTFERCLIYLHKMPRIWMEYCGFLTRQRKITRSRTTFDRALRALPLGQHERIWKLYIKFVLEINIPEVVCRVYRRYLKINPEPIEDYIDYLSTHEKWEEASRLLSKIVNDDYFVSQKDKSKHALWMQLCTMISQHPNEICKTLKVESIIRSGLQKFTDEVGRLWAALADYYIRQLQFERARNIFEEAMNTVMTVRDFSQIWDGYTHFEDRLITLKMEEIEMEQEEQEKRKTERQEKTKTKGKAKAKAKAKKGGAKEREEGGEGEEKEEERALEQLNTELDLLIARYEQLLDRRSLLISSVVLRQNPHNVSEWHKRVKIMQEKKSSREVVETFTQALKTVDPTKATGKPHTLWNAFARFYETHGDLENARVIYEKGTKETRFKAVDDLASIWVDWVEAEISHGNYEMALQLLQKATLPPSNPLSGKSKDVVTGLPNPVNRRLHKSTRLWSFYADVEEAYGSLHSTKAVYEKIIELKIATPQIIINYAHFLEEKKYFEESFKAYERGVALFPYPFVFDIWIFYLTKFVKRYGGKKLERARDLYEQAIEKAPPQIVKYLYVMYGELEEKFGLARHAMSIYDRGTRAVADTDRYPMFLLYISRASELFGIVRTREIYEKAIEVLTNDKEAKDICLRYAEMEKRLGEIDRARAIYLHGAQFSDPRTPEGGKFWKTWEDFEVQHGNEETYRELLRVKRSVQAQFNIQQGPVALPSSSSASSSSAPSASGPLQLKERETEGEDDMAALERQATAHQASQAPPTSSSSVPSSAPSAALAALFGGRALQFASAGQTMEHQFQPKTAVAPVANDEEISLDDDEDEDSEEEEEEGGKKKERVDVTEKAVPDSVFGSLKKRDREEEESRGGDGKRNKRR